mmetsp:Transcript_63823/g.71435  ORF Transcript_63823/g.71435 Transcript_63823/m.71435 type:complete len:92 (-) Transcript_63823:14-289(-)
MTRTTQLAVTTGLEGRTSWMTTPTPTPYRDVGLPCRSVPPVAAPLVAATTATADTTATSKKSSVHPMTTTTTTADENGNNVAKQRISTEIC